MGSGMGGARKPSIGTGAAKPKVAGEAGEGEKIGDHKLIELKLEAEDAMIEKEEEEDEIGEGDVSFLP